MATYYELLGASHTATVEDIQAAFDKRALELLKSNDSAAEAALKQLKEARKVLIDPAQRAGYDAAMRSLGISDPNIERTVVDQTVSVAAPLVAGSPMSIPMKQAQPVAAPAPVVPDKQLINELLRRGIDPGEAQLIARAGQGDDPYLPVQAVAKQSAAAPHLPPSKAVKLAPSIALPTVREVSDADQQESSRLLTQANLAYRRRELLDAVDHCRAAIEKAPSDVVAIELYGDVLQSLGRVDDALYCYQRANEIANRPSAERKFAELMLLQNRELQLLQDELIPSNPTVAVLLSSLAPGVGQMYKGELVKGLVIFGMAAGIAFLLGWTDLGFSGAAGSIPTSLVVLLFLAASLYIYNVVDAKKTGKAHSGRSGWDV